MPRQRWKPGCRSLCRESKTLCFSVRAVPPVLTGKSPSGSRAASGVGRDRPGRPHLPCSRMVSPEFGRRLRKSGSLTLSSSGIGHMRGARGLLPLSMARSCASGIAEPESLRGRAGRWPPTPGSAVTRYAVTRAGAVSRASPSCSLEISRLFCSRSRRSSWGSGCCCWLLRSALKGADDGSCSRWGSRRPWRAPSRRSPSGQARFSDQRLPLRRWPPSWERSSAAGAREPIHASVPWSWSERASSQRC